MKMNKDFLILLLQILEKEDMSGYKIIISLAEKSNDVCEFNAGIVYPYLHKLIQCNCLICYSQQVNGRIKKYYRITSQGRNIIRKMELL